MSSTQNVSGLPNGTSGEYVKPALVVIELKAEEVLAVGCKTVTRPAMPNIGAGMCGISQGCATEGS